MHHADKKYFFLVYQSIMITYISMLRGINVGGNRIIKMDALRQCCATLGFQDVKTYIQSGNIIFKSKVVDSQELSDSLKNVIKSNFGFDVPVITMKMQELEAIVANNPFSKDNNKEETKLHVTFLSEKPDVKVFELLQNGDYQNDALALFENAVYLYCPVAYHSSKLSNIFFEKKLKLTATTRNWKTTKELVNISKASL